MSRSQQIPAVDLQLLEGHAGVLRQQLVQQLEPRPGQLLRRLPGTVSRTQGVGALQPDQQPQAALAQLAQAALHQLAVHRQGHIVFFHQGSHILPGGAVHFQPGHGAFRLFGADFSMAVGMADARGVQGKCFGFSRVMEQQRPAQGFFRRRGVQGMQRMLPHVVVVIGRMLLKTVHRPGFRQNRVQHIGVLAQDLRGGPPAQQLAQLHADALRRHMAQGRVQGMDGDGRFAVNPKAVGCREPQSPQDAQSVLPKAGCRIPHASNHARAQVFLSAKGVHQAFLRGPGHGVYGKIAPGQVLPYIVNKPHLIRVPVVRIAFLHAEGGNLVGVMPQHHRQRTVLEPGFHHPVAVKDSQHLLRRGGRAYVPILGRASQQRIPHASAHHIGLVACLAAQAQDQRRILGNREHE